MTPQGHRAGQDLPRPAAGSVIHIKQIRLALRWFRAFYKQRRGDLRRSLPFAPGPAQFLTVVVDASPWGIGGVQLDSTGTPVQWFADKVTREDLLVFNGRLGDPAFNTTWEALAIIVAIKLWLAPLHVATRVAIRSDSLSSLRAASRTSARSTGLNLVMGELALLEAEMALHIAELVHIPGLANKTADALSRLHAPTASAIPDMGGAVRAYPPPRPRGWWLMLAGNPRPGS